MYFIYILIVFYWSCVLALSKLYSHLESFKNREAFLKSSFLTAVGNDKNNILPQTTSIVIQRDRAMMFITKVVPLRYLGFAGGSVDLVELRLGDNNGSVEVVNFPLVTFSAELSTSGASIEQEVTKGYGISLSFQLQFESSLIQTGFTVGLGSSYALSTSLSQSMICRANPGSRAQLQVSTKMMLYPDAKTRNVTISNGRFSNGPWQPVTSSVQECTINGALFYRGDYLGLHRCVTDIDFFEDPVQRSWITIE